MPTVFSICMGWVSPAMQIVLFLVVLYVMILVVLKLFPNLILEILFLNHLCPPKWVTQLHKPHKKYKLENCKNYSVTSQSGNTLGVWHISPNSKYDSPEVNSSSLDDAEKVVIYCHGNAMHRGFWHRLHMYQALQLRGFHVVTFDYSGFGDSTGFPSAEVVVQDALSVYKWATDQITRKDVSIVFWGHSLGTAISSKALSLMKDDDDVRSPDALILEAPFTNIIEAADTFPISKLFYALYPFFREEIHQLIKKNKAQFATEDVLPDIDIPILILHAEDDHRIPLHLGEKLFNKTKANATTRSNFIRFIHIHRRHAVQHYTSLHPEICEIFEQFMDEVQIMKRQSQPVKRFETIKI